MHTSSTELMNALEQLGQIRAYGTGILGARQATEEQMETLRALVATLNYTIRPLKISLQKVARYAPGLGSVLGATDEVIENSSKQVMGDVRADILSRNFSMSPAAFFAVTTTAIDSGYNQLYQSLLPAAEGLLRARVAHAKAVLQTTVGIALLLLMLVVYFMAAIYVATMNSIRTLSQTVTGFVRGDLNGRVLLETRDELARIGNSFNIMADEVAELVAAQQAATRYARSLIEASLDPLVTISAEGKITDVNTATEKVTGVDREKLIGSDFAEYFTDPNKARDGYQQAFLQGAVIDHQLAIRHASGSVTDVLYNASVYRDTNKVLGVFAAARDITERKRMEDHMRQLANHDTLTNLPNRRLLNDRLTQAMAASRRSGCYGAVMFLDLDNFKPLNDTHGHAVGDLLLIEAANRLRTCVREMDTVARLGGDEFVLMLSKLDLDRAASIAEASIVAEKIRAVLAEPYVLSISDGGVSSTVLHHCTASIGVALFVRETVSQDDVLKRADVAMYAAKEAGRNSIRFDEEGNVAGNVEIPGLGLS